MLFFNLLSSLDRGGWKLERLTAFGVAEGGLRRQSILRRLAASEHHYAKRTYNVS